MENEQYKLPSVRIAFKIVDVLQTYTTITGILRKFGIIKPKHKWANTAINYTWMLAFVVLFPFIKESWVLVTLASIRLYETLIINTWMFIFRQSAKKPNNTTTDLENNIRLFILLLVQFMTTVILYAYLYRYTYITFPGSFVLEKAIIPSFPSGVAWIYHSLGIMTNQAYGFIQPSADISRVLTMSQVVYGLFYILLFISNILSSFNFRWVKSEPDDETR